MPFISKDWRSPGDHWVKIGPGWEKAKVLAYIRSEYFDNENGRIPGGDEGMQPHYNIATRCTREIRRQNTLSEALLQLDFYSACHDVRRFNYICRTIQLLLLNINYLPGHVQRILIRLLAETTKYARENNCHGQAKHLIQTIRNNMDDQPVWGGQLGSTAMWREHKSNIEKILVNEEEHPSYAFQQGLVMQDFPEEVIRQVVLKLNCDKDIEAFGESSLMVSAIAAENRVWRELCNYHFTPQQIMQVNEYLTQNPNVNPTNQTSLNKSQPNQNTNKNLNDFGPHWKLRFRALRRRFGLTKEEYAEELNLCKSCGTLFWSGGQEMAHSCGIPILIPVKPNDFIKYFCV